MRATAYDYKEMSARAHAILGKAFGPNAAIRTDEGEGGTVFVRIVSDKFDGLTEKEKQDAIWDLLRGELKEEAQAIALVLAFGTDQV
jgi:stress-induced morphogen